MYQSSSGSPSKTKSPRKRSPRKQTRWPNAKRKRKDDEKGSHNSSQETNSQRDILSFFKQGLKPKSCKKQFDDGCGKSKDKPLVIVDEETASDSEEKNEDGLNDLKCNLKLNYSFKSPTKDVKIILDEVVRTCSESTLNNADLTNATLEIKENESTSETLQDSPSKRVLYNYDAKTFQALYEEIKSKGLICNQYMKLLKSFLDLSDGAQELGLRLYQRKRRWIPLSKITYKIENIFGELTALTSLGFLLDKSKIDDIELVLNLLTQKDVLALGRKFCDSKVTTKTLAIEKLLMHTRRKDTIFGTERIKNQILKCGRELLDECYFVEEEFAKALTAVLMLFSLGSHFDAFTSSSDKNDYGICNLYSISQYLRGTIALPRFEIVNTLPRIYSDSSEFKQFCEAKIQVSRLSKLIEKNLHNEAFDVFSYLHDWFLSTYSEERFRKDASLPPFLHRFTYMYCFLKCLALGAETFERLKRYQDAVDIYFMILSQNAFSRNRRGSYWNRLLLDLDVHLKLPENSFSLAHVALEDVMFPQQKFEIFTRAKRLSERLGKPIQSPVNFEMPLDAPVETIDGQLTKRNILGRRNVFASVDDNGENIVGPEAVAIEYYLENGFNQGVHGETATILMLFGLLCWNLLFGTITESCPPECVTYTGILLTEGTELDAIKQSLGEGEDIDAGNSAADSKKNRGRTKDKFRKQVEQVKHGSKFFKRDLFPRENVCYNRDFQESVFISKYQSGPLDLGYPEFYENRKKRIEDHLEILANMTTDALKSIALDCHEKHYGETNALFNWEVLKSEEVISLLECIPLNVLIAILRKLLTDFRFYRSGFPDIIMWNELTHRWKVVEVKGPGDILSTKQRYWMHFLMSLGVDCVTCRVVSVHSKKIR